jgi:hypothetical protein
MMKLWILYFLPIYLFYDEFRVDAWDMYLSQLKVLHWCIGKDGGNEWKCWSNSKIGIHRIYLSDGWKKRQTYLAWPDNTQGRQKGGGGSPTQTGKHCCAKIFVSICLTNVSVFYTVLPASENGERVFHQMFLIW